MGVLLDSDLAQQGDPFAIGMTPETLLMQHSSYCHRLLTKSHLMRCCIFLPDVL